MSVGRALAKQQQVATRTTLYEHEVNKMKVLMVGATGKYASLVVPELRQRGVTVRALVRHESKWDAARGRGDGDRRPPRSRQTRTTVDIFATSTRLPLVFATQP